jgi:hypothetical protein
MTRHHNPSPRSRLIFAKLPSGNRKPNSARSFCAQSRGTPSSTFSFLCARSTNSYAYCFNGGLRVTSRIFFLFYQSVPHIQKKSLCKWIRNGITMKISKSSVQYCNCFKVSKALQDAGRSISVFCARLSLDQI